MERFGSSRLRIVWSCFSLLLTGLVFMAIRPGDGGNLLVFGTPIPLEAMTMMVDPRALFRGALVNVVAGVVPWTLMFSALLPALDSLKSRSLADTFKALGMGLVNGLFFSQVLLLPLWAASFRLVGTFFPGPVCLADLNATLLGIQLTIWALGLALVFRSNTGLAVVTTAGLQVAGRFLTWGGEYLGDPELFNLPRALVKLMAFLGKLLPTGQVPTDPLALTALPLSVGLPLLLVAALHFLPKGSTPKASRPARAKKG